MEHDNKKSVIRYQDMMITPDLLEYLDFNDISGTVKGLPERSLFGHMNFDILISYVTEPVALRRKIKRKYPVAYYRHYDAGKLTLKSLIHKIAY